MTVNHIPLSQPLGPGGLHVLHLQHLQHARTGNPGNQSRGGHAQGEGGQHQMRRGTRPGGRQPTQPHRKEQLQHQPQPEQGRRRPEEGDKHTHIIENRIFPTCRNNPRRNTDAYGHHEGRQSELCRPGKAFTQFHRHRPAAEGGSSQITPRKVGQEESELHVEGLVQMVLLGDQGDELIARLGSGDGGGRVAGDEAHDGKHQERRPEEYRDG